MLLIGIKDGKRYLRIGVTSEKGQALIDLMYKCLEAYMHDCGDTDCTYYTVPENPSILTKDRNGVMVGCYIEEITNFDDIDEYKRYFGEDK